MIDPVGRLHHPGASDPSATARVRVRLVSNVLHDLDATSEHLAGLAVWATAGVPVVLLAAFVGGPSAAMLTLVSLLAVPLLIGLRWRGRRARRLVSALPGLVDTLSRSLRSGATISQSLVEARAVSPPAVVAELDLLIGSIDRGGSLGPVLREWAAANNQGEIRLVAAALAHTDELQGSGTRALDGAGQTIRDRLALAAELKALTAQAAASMQALVALPIGFATIDVLGGGGSITYLTSTSFGQLCLVVGISLDLLGWLWMRTLVRRRLPA